MTTQQFDASFSHYTNSTAPTTVQTLTNQSHTHPTLLRSFLTFAIPAAPSNESLSTSTLRITSSSTGDSVDTITFHTTTTWDEATIFWNNQPAPVTALASLVAPAIVQNEYNMTISNAVITAAVGTNLHMTTTSVAAAGGDTFIYWNTRYNIDATKRPRLTLVYVPNVTYVTSFTALRAQGYTGSLSDMRRQNLLALLSLTEPQFKTNNDLEFQYLRSIGKTGTLNDMRKQP